MTFVVHRFRSVKTQLPEGENEGARRRMAASPDPANSLIVVAGVLLASVVCLTLGVAGVIRPRLWHNARLCLGAWFVVLLALLLAGNGITVDIPGEAGLVAILAAQLVILLAVGGLYQKSVNDPAFRSMALTLLTLVAGGANFFLLAWHLEEPPMPTDRKHYELVSVKDQVFDERAKVREVRTDQGTPIALYRCEDPMPWLAGEAARLEAEYLNKVIRVEAANPSYNCHGWTFTGGRFHIRGSEALIILRENGYYEVSDPQPGDVIAYWVNNDQTLCHTGVVKFTDGQGLVVIESKWDLLGRYLHAPEVQPYSQHFTYFRTVRGSNLLSGLSGQESAAE